MLESKYKKFIDELIKEVEEELEEQEWELFSILSIQVKL